MLHSTTFTTMLEQCKKFINNQQLNYWMTLVNFSTNKILILFALQWQYYYFFRSMKTVLQVFISSEKFANSVKIPYYDYRRTLSRASVNINCFDIPNMTLSRCCKGRDPISGTPLTLILAPELPGFNTISPPSLLTTACCFWMLEIDKWEHINLVRVIFSRFGPLCCYVFKNMWSSWIGFHHPMLTGAGITVVTTRKV